MCSGDDEVHEITFVGGVTVADSAGDAGGVGQGEGAREEQTHRGAGRTRPAYAHRPAKHSGLGAAAPLADLNLHATGARYGGGGESDPVQSLAGANVGGDLGPDAEIVDTGASRQRR